MAARNGYELVIKLLLVKDDVNPDSKDKFDFTPLLWTAKNEHLAVVELVISKVSIDTNFKNCYFGQTLLFSAVENWHTSIVILPVDHLDINSESKDNCGQTPLLWATKNRYENVVKLLLD